MGCTPTTGPPVLFPSGGPFESSQQPSPNPSLFATPLNALSFFYGHADFGRNIGLVDALIRRMGVSLNTRIEKGAETAAWRGGLLIDTPGEFSEKSRSALVKEAVRAFGGKQSHRLSLRLRCYLDPIILPFFATVFSVNVIVVIGTEKLQLEISKLMSTNKTVQVVRVPKSGGVE